MLKLNTGRILILSATAIAAMLSLSSCTTVRNSSQYEDYVKEYDVNDDNYNYWEEMDDYEIDSRGY